MTELFAKDILQNNMITVILHAQVSSIVHSSGTQGAQKYLMQLLFPKNLKKLPWPGLVIADACPNDSPYSLIQFERYLGVYKSICNFDKTWTSYDLVQYSCCMHDLSESAQ